MWKVLASGGAVAVWLAAGVAGQEAVRTTVLHGVELPYEVVDGWAVHAGDMILGTQKRHCFVRAFRCATPRRTRKRSCGRGEWCPT